MEVKARAFPAKEGGMNDLISRGKRALVTKSKSRATQNNRIQKKTTTHLSKAEAM